jgi:hypothetical protein
MQQYENNQVNSAKLRYDSNLATGVYDMPFNPRLVSQYVRLIAKRETSHHNVAVNMAMEMEDGSLARNPKENIDSMHPHFNHVFNNNKNRSTS